MGGSSFEPLVRPRLVELIAQARRQRVCSIIAPAGYGKSIALEQYLASFGAASVLFLVRTEHKTMLGFGLGLIRAFGSDVAGAERGLHAAYRDATGSATVPEALAGWLSAYLGERTLTVAIDDLHVAAADPDVERFLVALIDRTSANITWILSSRVSLDLPRATWHSGAHGEGSIGECDLRLRTGEAAIIARAAGIELNSENLEQLLTATSGWPAAFIFALRARMPVLGDIRPETRELLYAYLADQVFSAFSGREQDFLLDTALLPVIDVDVLAGAGWEAPHETHAGLRRYAGIIAPLSATRFRYHDLFRDFLDHRLRLRGLVGYRSAQLGAADLLEAAGEAEAAVRLRVEATDSDGILRMLRAQRGRLTNRISLEATELAVDALPESVRRSDADVLSSLARVRAFRGSWGESGALYRAAIERAEDFDFRVSLSLQYYGPFEHKRIDPNERLAVLAGIAVERISDQRTRSAVLCCLAEYRARNGEFDEAHRLSVRAIEGVASYEAIYRAPILYNAGLASYFSHRLAEARDRMTAALSAGGFVALSDLVARIHETLYLLAFNDGDWERAEYHAAEMVAHAIRSGELWMRVRSLSSALMLATLRGDGRRIEQLESLIDAERSPVANPQIAFARALRAAGAGDFVGAQRLTEMVPLAGTEHEATDLVSGLPQVALYAAASGHRGKAVAALDRATEVLAELTAKGAASGRCAMLATFAKLMIALTHTLLGQPRASQAVLAQIERDKLPATTALRHPLRATHLFNRIVQGSAERHQLDPHIAAIRDSGLAGCADLAAALPLGVRRAAAAFASLSKAELRILQLLARGGTTQAIADEVGRSPQTVSSHIGAILRKLGCKRSAEAVALAREHGIV
ncbi:MAG: LuxR C-terminal-related transcriptional regulator [Vulcanimicrobiaceae bacterium]